MITKAYKSGSRYYYTGLLLFMQAVVAFARSLAEIDRSVAGCRTDAQRRRPRMINSVRTLMNIVGPSPLFDVEPSRLSVNK